MHFHRAGLEARGVLGALALEKVPHGHAVRVAGIVICRQRPGSAKGVLFMTLEDEDGMINVVVMPDVFQAHRLLIATTPALEVRGTLERQHGVLNVLGAGFTPLPEVQASIASRQFR